MKLEISTFKITKGDKTLELTPEEAKQLYSELARHFGIGLDLFGPKVLTNNDAKTGGYRGGSFSVPSRTEDSTN